MVSPKYSKLQEESGDDSLSLSERYFRGGFLSKMVKGGAVFLLVGILLALCSSIFVDGLGYPLHASCKINWTFGLNCSSVSKALNQQIAKWTGPDNCNVNGGEKCLYKLVSSNSTLLLATHETPKQHYVDDLSFSFTDVASEICGVFGYSTSETWYAVLDKGTNYCNLHNLITGSGLDKTSGFKESTSDDVCTQYTSADCDTY